MSRIYLSTCCSSVIFSRDGGATGRAVEHVRQADAEITVEPLDVDLGKIEATIAFFKGSSGEVIAFFETH